MIEYCGLKRVFLEEIRVNCGSERISVKHEKGGYRLLPINALKEKAGAK